MKRYRLIQTACLAAMAVGLASCSQEDLASLGVAEGAPVTFTATGLAMPQVETRATTDGTWEEGMMVGVKIGSEAKEYAVSPDATDPTKATLAATQGVTPFYWANATETKSVEAWYPYAAGQTAMPTLVVQQDQNIEANYVASDYLSASGTVSYGNSALNFEHRTAKITLNFTETESSGVSMKDAQVVLYNLSTANGNPATIRCLKASEDGNTYQALIAPQTFEAGNALFHVKLADGQAHSYATDATIDFKAGSQYVFNVDFSDPQMNVIALSETIPWGSGSAGSGSLSVYNLANGDYYLLGQSGFRHYFVGTETNCTLMNDINLTPNEDGSSNWPLVGDLTTAAYRYRGTFDGAGHQVDYITMKTGTEYQKNLGFICNVVDGGTVKNLTIGRNSTFVASDCEGTGSVVGGLFEDGRIINCHSYASVTGHRFIGGIVGRIGYVRDDKGNLVAGCSFSGTISYDSGSRYYDKYVGGIVGYTYCSQTTDNGDNILNSVHVVGCYHAGSINVATEESDDGIGGLAGSMTTFYYGRLVYTGCYSTDALSSAGTTGRVGGLIGEVFDTAPPTAPIGIPSLSACYWSNHSGVGVGHGSSSLAESNIGFVDNNNTDWATATVNMNAAIKEWNATHDNLCPYHYVQTNGENQPPTLVEGAPN